MNQHLRETFGKNIRHLRTMRGYSQKDLGDLLNVSQRTISSWESGTKEPESIDKFLDICKLFKIQFEELLGIDLSQEIVFKSAQDAVMFLLNQQEFAAMGGFDPNKMTDEEVLSFAEEAQRMMRLLALEKIKIQ